jgi:hypothetical protein
VLAVRWYLRFGLSYRDVDELLAECSIVLGSKNDRDGDLPGLIAPRGCQAAIWYSYVRPSRICLRRIRYSAGLISGGRVPI